MFKISPFLFIIIIFLSSSSILIVQTNSQNPKLSKTERTDKIDKNNLYIQSNNITIDGNTEFKDKAMKNSWPGNGTLSNPYIISGFVFDRIVLSNNNVFTSPMALIQIRNVNAYFIIENNLFNASIQYAIYVDGVSHGIIKNNIFTSNLQFSNVGIYIDLSNNIIISNNKMIINNILSTSSYLELDNDENCTISGNTFTNYQNNINAGSNINVYNNSFNNSELLIETSAVNVMYNKFFNAQPNQNLPQNFGMEILPERNLIASIQLRKGSIIENNLFLNNLYGIYLAPASYSKIFITCPGFSECSDLPSNYAGSVLLHYSNNVIKNNEFVNNTNFAIYIDERDDNNTIYRNNFINNNQSVNSLNNIIQNTTQVFENKLQNKTNYWSYNGVGNYWSDYNYNINTSTTTSVVPMHFLANDSDPHPVTEPFNIETTPSIPVAPTILTSSIQSNSHSLNSTATGINQGIVVLGLLMTVATIAVLILISIEFIRFRKLKVEHKNSNVNFQTFIKNNFTLKKKQPKNKETMSEETLEILEEIIDENKEI